MKEWLKRSANPVDKEELERHDKWLYMMWPRLQLLRDQLNNERVLPEMRSDDGSQIVAPYLTRRDGLQRSFPNPCLKLPTGGGKTLLATAALERIQTDCFKRQTGFALWVVPSDAIYRQTWKNLANREHPCRQILERASGGRLKMLETIPNLDINDLVGKACC